MPKKMNDIERRNETMTLNAKWRMDDGFKRWDETMALNAKLRNNDGSKRQIVNNEGSERRSWE